MPHFERFLHMSVLQECFIIIKNRFQWNLLKRYFLLGNTNKDGDISFCYDETSMFSIPSMMLGFRFIAIWYCSLVLSVFGRKKISSYIAQYPVLRSTQSALHFTPLQTCSVEHHLDFSEKQSATLSIFARRLIVYISATVYSRVLIYRAM